MKLEQGQISIYELIILKIGLIVGTASALSFSGNLVNETWIATLIGLGEGLVFATVYLTLARKFPKKNLIEINNLIYGKYIGKLISFCYIWYFLHTASMVMRNMADFFKGVFMPETPMVVFIITVTLLVCSATRNGLEVIARCALILIPIDLFTSGFLTLMLIPNINVANLLPLFEATLKDLLKAGHLQAAFPFGETIVFLMFFAYIKEKELKMIPKATFSALIIAGVFIALTYIRNICILGPITTITIYPTFAAIRLINIGDVFTRIEAVTIFTLLSAGFIKMSIFFYGATLGTAQILNLRTYLPLVLPLGIIAATLSYILFDSVIHNMVWAREIFPFYSIPFQIGIPFLTLLIAILRKLPQKKQKNSH